MRPIFLHVTLILICLADAARSDDLVFRNPKTSPNDFIVLQTGRVVRGKLTPRQGGYDISLPTGRMFVASDQVRFRAATMTEAYQRMRESVPELTPETHLNLARWCLSNELPANAKREALDALHLDPYNDSARRLLEALVRHEKQSEAPSSKEVTLPMMAAPERRSLGGLPTSLARDFTRYVQPIIVNKCGNAACHGEGRNDFEIVSLRGGANAWTSERNLASILKQIDASDPVASPILKATQGSHGNSRTLSFSGPTGRQQILKLRDWVNRVSNEFGTFEAEPVSLTTSPKTTTPSTQLQSPETEATAALESDEQFLKQAVQVNRVDRFSPAEFNQRYHGLSANRIQTAEAQVANTSQNGY